MLNSIDSKRNTFFYIYFLLIFISACSYEKADPYYEGNGYPQAVGKIIENKCATSGCHNEKSKVAVAGLSLESWNKLFEGSRSGAIVIPYQPDFSTLIYYTNSYNEFGAIHLSPKMPIGKEALTKEEMKILYEWVKNGAPNSQGDIKFPDTVNRKTVYLTNQGCDVVTLIDSESKLAMRYVDVGASPSIEAPHMVKVAFNNQFWCVSFIAGTYFQKFSTIDNSLMGQVLLGFGSWNTFAISKDSKVAYVIDWSSAGKVAVVNLEDMTAIVYSGFSYPHGSALNASDDTLYVTSQLGNYLYKIPVNNFSELQLISLNGLPPNNTTSLDPHEIIFSPDGSKYFITCQKSNEIRIFKTSNDSLIATLATGQYPQEMGISSTMPYLFVSCMEENSSSNNLERGSVSIINYNDNTLIKQIYAVYQPHGIVVDEEYQRVYIANRNINTSGPAPHHSSVCFGRNGYVTAIDMHTLLPISGFKAEVSVDPYGLGISN